LRPHGPSAERAPPGDVAAEALPERAGAASQSGEANVVSIDAFRKKT
jgi:hypothetical protein